MLRSNPLAQGALDRARKLFGGVLLTLGWILSPLSWWNDALVNLPLAWVISSLVVQRDHHLFGQCLVLCYWLTNLAGLAFMYFGWKMIHLNKKISRKEILGSFFVSLIYTVVIGVLVQLGILKPLF